MTIINNFLPDEMFKSLREYILKSEFQIFDAGDKKFSYLPVPTEVYSYISEQISTPVLSFIRRAYPGFDDEPRIHCDGIINGEKVSLASVLYLNLDGEVQDNGTAFYSHKQHGEKFDGDEDEFNRLLLEDANDLSKWSDYKLIIKSEPNKLIAYDTRLFHSKFPYEIESGVRYVLVSFFK